MKRDSQKIKRFKTELLEKKYSYAASVYVFLYLFVVILCLTFMRYRNPDNDFYFLAGTGRYILEKREVPTVNPFVIHENFGMIVQQWLSSVANYKLFDLFDTWGLEVYCALVFLLLQFVIYLYSGFFTNARSLKMIVLIVSDMILASFMTSRPSAVTILVLLTELCVLECWEQKKNRKNLWILPVLSLFEINFHATFWPIQFVLMLPYVVPDLRGIRSGKISFKKITGYLYKKRAVWGIMLPMFLAGFLNPNGIKSMAYLFLSYQSANLQNKILELAKPCFLSYTGFFIAGSIVLSAVYLYVYRMEPDIKMVYMHLGTLFLACMHERNLWFLIPGGIPVLCSLMNGRFNRSNGRKTLSLKKLCCVIALQVTGLIMLLWIMGSVESSPDTKADSYRTPRMAADYLEQFDREKIKLYTEFDNGAFMEWKGYKVYIDARPELYQKRINQQEDIYSELIELISGDADMGLFLEKYNFTHLITKIHSKLDIFLGFQEDYEKVLEAEEYILYQRRAEDLR